MNRLQPGYSRAPLHFPMYLLSHDEEGILISEMDTGREIKEVLMLLWAHDQIGEEADEDTPDEDRYEAIEYTSAGELIPVIEEALRMGVPEVIYGLLPRPGVKGESDEPSMNVLGREPTADFLARLQERAAQEDRSDSN